MKVEIFIGICTETQLVASKQGCHYYEVCLKGFKQSVATLKCPESLWFDPTLNTCVRKVPVS